ncbi:amidase [Sphingopyxis fribergensis]
MIMGLIDVAEAVRSGSLSARESVGISFDRVERTNGTFNAFVALDREAADMAADAIDAKVARGEDPGPLAGVPFGVKDMEDCAGFRTTQGSWFLRDAPIAKADSLHVARLRAAGAIPIGKTATAEFGMDSATNTRLFGITRNPWNPATTPGGSSGGSSAAVAAGMVPLATGSDAAGSIREPAAFTGLIGLKPSHGRIAKENGFSNWSVRGALTRSVADTARYLDVAAGPNDRDRQSLPAPDGRYETAIETLDVAGLRAVWSGDHGYAVVDPEVMDIARRAADRLIRAAGLVEVAGLFAPTNVYTHLGAIQLVNLEADFTAQGILPDGFEQLSPQVQYFVELMRREAARIDLKESWGKIHQLERDVAEFFAEHDLLLSPATACPAYAADGRIPDVIDGRDASEGGAEPFGALANVCWNPSISIPAGLTSDGLPVGLQITARRHRDDILLRLARILEREAPIGAPPGFA